MSANYPFICSKCDKFFETERDFSFHYRRCGSVRKRKISLLDVSPSKLVQLLDQCDANRDRFYRDNNVNEDDGQENIQPIATQTANYHTADSSFTTKCIDFSSISDYRITDQDEFGSGDDVENNINIESDEDY